MTGISIKNILSNKILKLFYLLSLRMSHTTESILGLLKEMDGATRVEVACKVFHLLQPDEEKVVKNFWIRQRKRRHKQEVQSERPAPNTITQPIHGCSLIFREDLIPQNSHLYLDVEKVSTRLHCNALRPYETVFTNNVDMEIKQAREQIIRNQEKHHMVAGSIALIDEKLNVILWAVLF